MPTRPQALAVPAALLANGIVLAILALAHLLDGNAEELYYRAVQEDGWLEWMTFWAFIAAAGVFGVAARGARRAGAAWPWFALGVALFCFVVAMEEISWGQRVLGYRPPEYFLAENFQQELNVHNVMDSDLRKLLVKVVILGYGVVLPVLALPFLAGRILGRLGVVAPPASLIPAFFATYLTYETYPWRFSGEWIELTLGLGFLFAGLALPAFAEPTSRRVLSAAPAALAGWTVAVALVGLVTAGVTRALAAAGAGRVDGARAELVELAADLRSGGPGGRPLTRCGIHKRVFSYVEKYEVDELWEGRYAGLAARGLPEARAEFFLDPWNSPYWLRHKCRDGRELAYVYSFGPDRRRNSTDWRIEGDDVGEVILERSP